MQSCILFANCAGTVILLDIPRSIEEAQVAPGHKSQRCIISCEPQRRVWDTPEPKCKGGMAGTANAMGKTHRSPSAAIAELMTLETVRAAHQELRQGYKGPFCLPRAVPDPRRAVHISGIGRDGGGDESSGATQTIPEMHHRQFLPPSSHYLLGTISSQRSTFLRTAPSFDLIVLDPPWPSRSVKRKRKRGRNETDGGQQDEEAGYSTVSNMEDARELLSQIPVQSHLKPDGLVAVWVTNKPAVTDLLHGNGTGDGKGRTAGILSDWGLEPVGEWSWLKITRDGDPVVDLDSQWRKPWERLIIARRKGSAASLPVPRRTILGVPDLHSRKPNLRGLFHDIWPDGYRGLEIFARNLTAGWWGWGDDVLCFQQRHHWIERDPVAPPE